MCLSTSRISFNLSPCWTEGVLARFYLIDTLIIYTNFFHRKWILSCDHPICLHGHPQSPTQSLRRKFVWDYGAMSRFHPGSPHTNSSSKFPAVRTLSYHLPSTLASSYCVSFIRQLLCTSRNFLGWERSAKHTSLKCKLCSLLFESHKSSCDNLKWLHEF